MFHATRRLIGILFLLLAFGPTQSALAQDEWENDDCMLCHEDPEELPSASPELLVDLVHFVEGVHADMDCVECHEGIEDLPHEEKLPPVDCASCHEDAQDDFMAGVHSPEDLGKRAGKDITLTCVHCHGAHDIYFSDDSRSTTSHLNMIRICRECHFEDVEPIAPSGRKFNAAKAYDHSVHFQALVRGNEESANCADCHGHHKILSRVHEESRTHPNAIATTCGECHPQEAEEFVESIHGQSLAGGDFEAPDCTTCHGGHEILGATDPLSLTSPNRLSREICASCHSSPLIARRFHLSSNQPDTYYDSYHGLAGELGSVEIASCASCHGVHDIFGEKDPRASTHPDNREETCKQCHPDASPRFVSGSIHTTTSDPTSPWVVLVRVTYYWLIACTLGFMIPHNLLLLGRSVLNLYRKRKTEPGQVRFKRVHRIQHHLLALSFIILVVTGFALKFPDSLMTRTLSFMGMTEAGRSLVHHGAGVVSTAVFVFHILGLFLTRGGRRECRALFPGWKDVVDLRTNISYNLGRREEEPKYGRFTYWEKMEYWALIWGMMVMAVTGFILWFPEIATSYTSKLLFDISEMVHFYEAILATAAIFIWHFFFVIFDPKEYPVSFTMFDGRITDDELREHHALELEEQVEKEEAGEPEEEAKDS